uniref:T9SS type A sorting domain-containing protein n=1 Tax=uncultured Draconibacterium sp. TaxID=1573823 RepID=UPI003216D394
MRKIYLFVLIVLLGVSVKAQYVNLVENSAEGELSTSPTDLIAAGDELVYSGRYNYYDYYSTFFGEIVTRTGYDTEMFIFNAASDTISFIDLNTETSEATDAMGETYTKYTSSYFDNPIVYNNVLYFEAQTDDTTRLFQYVPGSGAPTAVTNTLFNSPQVHNDTLYFCEGGNAPIGYFDGTTVVTFSAMDTLIDVYNYEFTMLNNKFIVSGEDEKTSAGNELYVYDPAQPDTVVLLADINVGSSRYDDANVRYLTNAGEKVYFRVYTYKGTASGSTAYTIWETNGTAEGTVPVDAINSQIDSLSAEILFADDDMLYFYASVGGVSTHRQLFSYNTSSGVVTHLSANADERHYPKDMAKLDGVIYYAGSKDSRSFLYKIEGSGVELVDSLVFDVENLTVLDGKLYFSGNMMLQSEEGGFVETGSELMVYDPNNTTAVNPYLSDLTLADTTIDGFDAFTGSYEVILPVGGTAASIGGTPADPAATVTVTQATAVPGVATIEVVAADGVTTRTYTVNFREVSTDATLAELNIADTLIAGFDPAVLSYEIKITSDSMEIPEISGVAFDMNATVTVVQADTLPGTATVTVVAEDGTTEMVYTINFVETITAVDAVFESQFNVYPTVTNQYFNVDLGSNKSARVSVFSLTGQMILDKEFQQSQAKVHVDKAGIYLIRVTNESEMKTFKVIKQ